MQIERKSQAIEHTLSRFTKAVKKTIPKPYAIGMGAVAGGVAIGFAVAQTDVSGATKDLFFGGDEAKTPLTKAQLEVLYQESGLDPEVIVRVSESSLRYTLSVDSAYNDLKFGEIDCNAFALKGAKGETLIATAAHCWPDTIKMSDSNQEYSTYDANGKSILRPTITDNSGTTHALEIDNFYPEFDRSPLSPDVALFTTFPVDHLNIPALEISDKKLESGDYVYRLSRDRYGALSVAKLLVLNQLNGVIMLLDLSPGVKACITGTSGSAIVDEKGGVVGQVYAQDDKYYVITDENAQAYGLPDLNKVVGHVMKRCFASSASTIKGLLGN